ncbi:acyl carrier protein [Magnetofaba australis]|uniref:Putative acyl carrier protein n=1 Tax=Magnetofaba australis IT-1 TaxID=1434232 RepID=A0A1Y2K9U8_9PROT|nr:acyl carrier protein [Magnetofaba australis]OSM08444.1 putative acyl carrier protein [Magnetofaba australis IT-1]
MSAQRDAFFNAVSTALGCPVDSVANALDNGAALTWDSLQHLTLVMSVESALGVKLAVEEALGANDIPKLAALLKQKGASL